MTHPSVFMDALRQCVRIIEENVAFIRKELPNVQLTYEQRTIVEQRCSRLIGTDNDVFHELSELYKSILISQKPDTTDEFISAADCVVRWLWEVIEPLHPIVEQLHEDAESDPSKGLAFFLVSESTTNILEAFNDTKDALETVLTHHPNKTLE